MQTSTTPVAVNTKLGTLFVAIHPAMEDTHHRTGVGTVTELYPRLFMSASSQFSADPGEPEAWMIRGRKYGVSRISAFRSDRWFEGGGSYWAGDGYLDDRGGKVKVDSATWNAIDDALRAGREVFVASHPQWADLSMYLYHNANAEAARLEEARLRAEADKHALTAHGQSVKAADVFSFLPDTLTALIP